ncbi:MAG TPA: hypothetical protein VJV78_39700 [Polyangiales bacterium]|nr:hypothetical protein [Polyangiales bacterium]
MQPQLPPLPPQAPVQAEPPVPQASPPTAASPRARFRVAKKSGAVKTEPAALGTLLETAAGAELTVDLVNGGRLVFGPATRVLLLDAEPAALVLLSGQLYAQLLPQGQVPGRAPLRVVIESLTLGVPEAGELWLGRPRRAAGTYAALLAGSAEREQLEADGTIARHALIAGQDMLGAAPPRRAGPRTLEQAQQAYARVQNKLARPDESQAGAALDRALAAWAEAEGRARALAATQRAAKERGDTAAVQAAQHELVTLAQHKLDLRQQLRLAFELAAIRVLDAADASALESFRASYAERAAAIMPAGSSG